MSKTSPLIFSKKELRSFDAVFTSARKKKLEYTKELIRCWVESWGVDNIYIAFSGGKDSLVLRHIVLSLYPEIRSIFSNTGLEFPEIVKFVKSFDNVDIIKPQKTFKQVIEKCGWPVISKEVAMAISRLRGTSDPNQRHYRLWGKMVNGKRYTAGVIPKKYHFMIKAPFKISENCCLYLKKKPFKKYEKETGRKPILGIMAVDSKNRRIDIRERGCNVYDADAPQSRPLAHWNESDIWAYIYYNQLEYCKIYNMGYDRTGCVFCLFGLQQEIKKQHSNRFLTLKQTHPKLYDYVINKLGAKEVLDFMNIPY